MSELITDFKKLDGKIFALLDKDEFNIYKELRDKGRKLGYMVNFVGADLTQYIDLPRHQYETAIRKNTNARLKIIKL